MVAICGERHVLQRLARRIVALGDNPGGQFVGDFKRNRHTAASTLPTIGRAMPPWNMLRSAIYLFFATLTQAQTLDVLLTGGSVVDGTGAAAHVADVGIRGDRIAFVGDAKSA